MSLRDEVLNTKIYSRHLETYVDYKKNVLPKIEDLDKQWVFDIIDGKKEKDQVLYQDDDFVLLPSDKWKNNNILEMRLLAFFTNKKLKSIRDLTGSNIKLLEKVKNKACEIIKNKYKLDEEHLKIFFHYRPSVWQLHLHFLNLEYKTKSSSIEKSHEVHTVIENLKIDTNYYKKVGIYCYQNSN
jgi:m7GpppX diphosphatase